MVCIYVYIYIFIIYHIAYAWYIVYTSISIYTHICIFSYIYIHYIYIYIHYIYIYTIYIYILINLRCFWAKAGLQIYNFPKVDLQMWIQRGGSSISQTPTSKAFSGCLLRTFKSHPSGSNKMPSDLEEKDEFFYQKNTLRSKDIKEHF